MQADLDENQRLVESVRNALLGLGDVSRLKGVIFAGSSYTRPESHGNHANSGTLGRAVTCIDGIHTGRRFGLKTSSC